MVSIGISFVDGTIVSVMPSCESFADEMLDLSYYSHLEYWNVKTISIVCLYLKII